MKKILSLALAAAMVMSALPVAYAAEGEHDYSNGTTITMVGTQEEAAGGAGDVWTVTVPAKMVPGDTGTVKAEGTWAADKYLQVTHSSTVALTYGAQSMDVAISGTPIMLIGSSVNSVSQEQKISVAEASRLFGTWEGTIVYDVQLIHKGDFNADGVIDATDQTLILDAVLSQSTDLQYDLTGDGLVNGIDSARHQVLLNLNGIETTTE